MAGDGDFVATVKRDHFPYLTMGRTISIDAVELYAIHDGKVDPTTPGLDVGALTDALAAEGMFDLSLAADDGVLVREQQAQVFVLIKYHLE